jgi:hypothetical protein
LITTPAAMLAVLSLLTATPFEGLAGMVDASDTNDRFIHSLRNLAERDSPVSESDVLKSLEMDPKTYSRDTDPAIPGITYSTAAHAAIRALTFRLVAGQHCCQPAQSLNLRLAEEDCIAIKTLLASPFKHRTTVTTTSVPDYGYFRTLYHDFYYRVSGDWETIVEVNWPASRCTTQLNITHQYCGKDCFR